MNRLLLSLPPPAVLGTAALSGILLALAFPAIGPPCRSCSAASGHGSGWRRCVAGRSPGARPFRLGWLTGFTFHLLVYWVAYQAADPPSSPAPGSQRHTWASTPAPSPGLGLVLRRAGHLGLLAAPLLWTMNYSSPSVSSASPGSCSATARRPSPCCRAPRLPGHGISLRRGHSPAPLVARPRRVPRTLAAAAACRRSPRTGAGVGPRPEGGARVAVVQNAWVWRNGAPGLRAISPPRRAQRAPPTRPRPHRLARDGGPLPRLGTTAGRACRPRRAGAAVLTGGRIGTSTREALNSACSARAATCPATRRHLFPFGEHPSATGSRNARHRLVGLAGDLAPASSPAAAPGPVPLAVDAASAQAFRTAQFSYHLLRVRLPRPRAPRRRRRRRLPSSSRTTRGTAPRRASSTPPSPCCARRRTARTIAVARRAACPIHSPFGARPGPERRHSRRLGPAARGDDVLHAPRGFFAGTALVLSALICVAARWAPSAPTRTWLTLSNPSPAAPGRRRPQDAFLDHLRCTGASSDRSPSSAAPPCACPTPCLLTQPLREAC